MSEETATIFGLSAGFMVLIIVISILWFTLCVILFFKLWGMTNDISEIKDILREQLELEHPYVDSEDYTKEKVA